MKSQPDLKLLLTFMAVVDRGSMAEAAAALGYVPSAVSQHIAALERDMGIELVIRRPGSRLILTAAGRSLAQATEALFDATARFQDAANGISNREIAELRVGAYPSAMSHLSPRFLSALKPRGRGPRIRLVIVETTKGCPRSDRGTSTCSSPTDTCPRTHRPAPGVDHHLPGARAAGPCHGYAAGPSPAGTGGMP